MITAIVLINTAQGCTAEVAQTLIGLPGITEAYSVAGAYDLVAIVRVGDHEKLADLIAGQVQKGGKHVTAEAVAKAVSEGDEESAKKVRAYERDHKDRSGVIEAADRRVDRK